MSILTKNNYYPYFDYLRFILASVVMLGHDGLIGWFGSGKLAVDIFFALSGWLIGGILLNTSAKDLPRFYFNRAIRIWIPYFVALFLIILASLLRDPINAKWLEFITYKITFTYNIFGTKQLADHAKEMPLDGTANHFWSVNAEEQFYLLAPIVIVFLSKIGRTITAWLVLFGISCIYNLYMPISLGVLAIVSVNKYGSYYEKKAFKIIFLAIAVIASTFLFLDTHETNAKFHIYASFLSISLVLLLAVKGKQDKFGEFLGGMSYPLYLNHWIGVFVANFLLNPFGLKASMVGHVLSTLLNYIIAAVLYYFIDRKILPMRKKWFNFYRGVTAVGFAYGLMFLGITLRLLIYN